MKIQSFLFVKNRNWKFSLLYKAVTETLISFTLFKKQFRLICIDSHMRIEKLYLFFWRYIDFLYFLDQCIFSAYKIGIISCQIDFRIRKYMGIPF
jgi:hypothetical protein